MDLQQQQIEDRLGEAEFRFLRELIYQESGIRLDDSKRDLVQTRLRKRLIACGVRSFAEYRQVLDDPVQGGEELFPLLDAITTNHTSFFREEVQFRLLADEWLPGMLAAKRAAGRRRIRLWCAACATGEEPYTLTIVLTEGLKGAGGGWDVKILATDISSRALERARLGLYPGDRVATMPASLVAAYFQQGTGRFEEWVRVKPMLQEMVAFRRLNLMDQRFPFTGTFDMIWLRNVMIYFDRPTQEALVRRVSQYLAPDGLLIVGLSETLLGFAGPLKAIRPGVYKKSDG